MSSERKECGCLIQTTVSNDGEILTRTDYCLPHGKEMMTKSDREWEERKAERLFKK